MKKIILTLAAFAVFMPAAYAQNGGFEEVRLGKSDLYQMYGDSIVDVTDKVQKAYEVQKKVQGNANYWAYVNLFWEKLKDHKVLDKNVDIKDFEKNYLVPTEVFKAILPTYKAVKPKGSVIADDINRGGAYRLAAIIDGTFYSLNNLPYGSKSSEGTATNREKLYLLKWNLGIIKEVELDGGFFCTYSLDVTICTNEKAKEAVKITHKWDTRYNVQVVWDFVDDRLRECKVEKDLYGRPKTSFWTNSLTVCPALGAYGDILEKFDDKLEKSKK